MTPDSILHAVAADYDILIATLQGRQQTATVSEARHLAMWLMRDLTSMSHREIGVYFGRDASTVNGAVRGMEVRLKDPATQVAQAGLRTRRLRIQRRLAASQAESAARATAIQSEVPHTRVEAAIRLCLEREASPHLQQAMGPALIRVLAGYVLAGLEQDDERLA